MSRLSRSTWLGAIVTLLGASASPQELPKAPKAEMIVTPKPGFFTEPSIAGNPNKPEQVVAAFQDNAHVTYSVDAGDSPQGSSRRTIAFPAMSPLPMIMRSAPSSAISPSSSWGLLTTEATIRREMVFMFDALWTAERPGSRKT